MNTNQLSATIAHLRAIDSDDADIPLSANEIYSLRTANVITADDRAPVAEARIADLDETLYSIAFANASRIMPRALRGAETVEKSLPSSTSSTPKARSPKQGCSAQACTLNSSSRSCTST